MRFKKDGLWVVWVGLGFSCVLHTAGVHWLIAESINGSFFTWWAYWNIEWGHVVMGLLASIAEIFFRDLVSHGEFKVPEKGPLILVCAPHANQFIDPVVATTKLKRRDIRFIAAASSLRKPYIGHLMRGLNPISVERPQDLSVTGAGRVTIGRISDEKESLFLHVLGDKETRFLSLFKSGYTILLTDEPYSKKSSRVLKVVSNSHLILQSPLELPHGLPTSKHKKNVSLGAKSSELNKIGTKSGGLYEKGFETLSVPPSSYKMIPRVNNQDMYTSVFDCLDAGGAVGVFPEGGSHDQSRLLPLKAGVSLMALGALARNKNLPLRIIPVGLNYYKGHRFHGSVFVEYGDPIIVSPHLVDNYIAGGALKRVACTELLDRIKLGLSMVTFQAPDAETLEFFRGVRRMYAEGCTQGMVNDTSTSKGAPVRMTSTMKTHQSHNEFSMISNRNKYRAVRRPTDVGLRRRVSSLNGIKRSLSNPSLSLMGVAHAGFDLAENSIHSLRKDIGRHAEVDHASLVAKFNLGHAIASGYSSLKSHPRVLLLRKHIEQYNLLKKNYGIPDHKIASVQQMINNSKGDRTLWSVGKVYQRLAVRVPMLIIWCLMIPLGLVIAGPCIILTRVVSGWQQRKALKKSRVKIEARDVVATWKVIVGMVFIPMQHIIYTVLCWYYLAEVYAVIYFFFSPFLALIGIQVSEIGFRLFFSVRALFMAALTRGTGGKLIKMRAMLQKEVVSVVDELGWVSGKLEEIVEVD